MVVLEKEFKLFFVHKKKWASFVLPKQALREQAGVLGLPRNKGSLRSLDSERQYSSIYFGIHYVAFPHFYSVGCAVWQRPTAI